MDKSQSIAQKDSNTARISTSYILKWNTSILHADKYSCMKHEKQCRKTKKWERLLTVPIHQKWLAIYSTSLLNLLIIVGWRTLHLQVLSISAQACSSKLFGFFGLTKLLWSPVYQQIYLYSFLVCVSPLKIQTFWSRWENFHGGRSICTIIDWVFLENEIIAMLRFCRSGVLDFSSNELTLGTSLCQKARSIYFEATYRFRCCV